MQINTYTSTVKTNYTPLKKTTVGRREEGQSVLLDLSKRRADEFLRLIEQLFGHQIQTFRYDEISEDGFFGVEQTSERLFNMALAFSGGDPEKLEEMRDAVIKGFNKAKGVMGGELPEISHDTLARTMERFDEWFVKNS